MSGDIVCLVHVFISNAVVEELKKERRNARPGGWPCLGCQMGLPWELVSGFCKKEARRAASSRGVGMWQIVATGVCWTHRSCAGPCDGAPGNGSCEGECPWELCSPSAFLWALPMQSVISTLLPHAHPRRPGSGDHLVLAFSYC